MKMTKEKEIKKEIKVDASIQKIDGAMQLNMISTWYNHNLYHIIYNLCSPLFYLLLLGKIKV